MLKVNFNPVVSNNKKCYYCDDDEYVGAGFYPNKWANKDWWNDPRRDVSRGKV